MNSSDIARLRLINQQIAGTKFKKPSDLVSWFGCMQAQDYPNAKWAIGLRIPGLDDQSVEQAFNKGTILRTHILRPTWHFVTPADIRWIQALTSLRVHAFDKSRRSQLGLEVSVFKKSLSVLTKALPGKQLTRTELADKLKQAGIKTDENRLAHILMKAELDGIICSGGRKGKQFKYALLDEVAPQSVTIEADEALSELAKRYFASHGPATAHDFAWWSGLTVTEAKKGIDIIQSQLILFISEEKKFWMKQNVSIPKDKSASVFLLPAFDEYAVAYKDRSAILDPKHVKKSGNGIFKPIIVINGKAVGNWKRIIKKNKVIVETDSFDKLSNSFQAAIEKEIKRYVKFVNLPLNGS
jgi:hypothetical protein